MSDKLDDIDIILIGLAEQASLVPVMPFEAMNDRLDAAMGFSARWYWVDVPQRRAIIASILGDKIHFSMPHLESSARNRSGWHMTRFPHSPGLLGGILTRYGRKLILASSIPLADPALPFRIAEFLTSSDFWRPIPEVLWSAVWDTLS